MGHNVTGFIVPAPKAQEVFNAFTSATLRFAPLGQGMVLFPLTDELLEVLFEASSCPFAEFVHLNADLTNLLMRLSTSSPILYFETDYHGGVGGQSAILFRGGHVVFGPEHHFGTKLPNLTPISEALELMGIGSTDVDAFEAVGLSKHRNTEDWLD